MKLTTSMPTSRATANLAYRTRMVISRVVLLLFACGAGEFALLRALEVTHQPWPRTLTLLAFAVAVAVQLACVTLAAIAYIRDLYESGRRRSDRPSSLYDDGGAALRATAMARIRRGRKTRHGTRERA